MKRLIYISFIALLVCLSTIAAANNAPLRIVTEDFPPYNYQEDAQIKGLSTEVVQAVFTHLGLKTPQFEFYPWARSYYIAQKQPNVLIFSIARIPERENLFHWVGTIAPYRTSLYKMREDTDTQVNSLEDARQYRIGVSQDDVITTYLQSRDVTNLEIVGRDVFNIDKLRYRRLNLIAYDEASFNHIIQKRDIAPDVFERVYRLTDLSDQLYMAFSKGTSMSRVREFRAALLAVKTDGTFNKILNKYFPE